MTRGLRVVLVVGRSTGGIGTHVDQLAASLRDLGHEVRLVSDPLTASTFGWPDALTWWPCTAAALPGSAQRLRGLARTADVVHAHGYQAAGLAAGALLGLRHRPRFVVSLHNPLPSRVTPAPGALAVAVLAVESLAVELVAGAVLRRADLVTGASSDLVEQARALGALRPRLAPVPSPRVPTLLALPEATVAGRAGLREPLLWALGVDPGQVDDLVVTLSRVAPQKNLDVVVEAGRMLPERVAWVVVGAGDADLTAALQQQAVGTRVLFAGPRPDVVPWLRAASMLVLASGWEARALVVQEAMAAGTPVVAPDVGGLAELLDGTGTLVPAQDPAGLAARLATAVRAVLAGASGRDAPPARARAVAAGWPDGAATARQWVAWYAADSPMT